MTDLTPAEERTERAYQWLTTQGFRDPSHYRCVCERWVHDTEALDHAGTCDELRTYVETEVPRDA